MSGESTPPPRHGTRVNPEIKYLMLRHAFNFVDSVVFKVGAQNVRSQRAVLKLGATAEVGSVSVGGVAGYAYRLTRSTYLASHRAGSARPMER